MKCFVIAVKYVSADNYAYIDQGYKRGEYPEGYVLGGSNGTYRVWGGSPADIIVFLRTAASEEMKISIGNEVRRIMNRRKLTERLAQRIIYARPMAVEIDSDKRIVEADLVAWFSKA